MKAQQHTILFYGTDAKRLAFIPKDLYAQYYTTDTDKYYLWNGVAWIVINGSGTGGMEIHGNEYHNPDFEPANSNIQAHVTVAHEPANSNIQAHVLSAHSPADAQKNSDILKAEIEAKLTGEISTHTHAGGGGSSELWEGKVHTAMFDGNPLAEPFMNLSNNTTLSPTVTPTNIGIAVGRMVAFRFKTAITVATIRWYGIGTVASIYTAAIYRDSDGARLWAPTNVNTTANAWGSNTADGLPITFAANTLYWFGIGADTIGTTAGFITPPLPKVASFGRATPSWTGLTTIGMRFCQVALTAGVFPATLPTKVNAAAWTGFIPVFYLCASGY